MIKVALDDALRIEVETIFKNLGLSPDDAIGLFYQKVSQYQGLPFDMVPNAETQQAVDDARANKLIPITIADINEL